ncbi:hypothetical protein CDIK_3534 [Cucumispora dikerogammari]|nr:hypothetical protein CDIK_3534 [Cucumispora dikerogammari]
MFGEQKIIKLNLSSCSIFDYILDSFLYEWEVGANAEIKNDGIQEKMSKLNLNEQDDIYKLELSDNMRLSYEYEDEERKYNQIIDLSHNYFTKTGIDKLTKFLEDKLRIMLYITKCESADVFNLVTVVKNNSGLVVIRKS